MRGVAGGEGGGKLEYGCQFLAAGKFRRSAMSAVKFDVGVEAARLQHAIESGNGGRLAG